MNALDAGSTRPYLIRALYEWCTDHGLTPYVAVRVDESVQVPREYVKNNEIVLNISFDATSSLKLGNEFIEFKARFSGSAREIIVPIDHVIAIYARENGQGMAFPAPEQDAAANHLTPGFSSALSAQDGPAETRLMQLVPDTAAAPGSDPDNNESPEPPKTSQGARPSLKRVK
jgi:stringent starvation protein B